MRVPTLRLVSLISAVWLAACSPAPDGDPSRATTPPDIVLLVVDGLRVDRLDRLLADPAVAPLASRLGHDAGDTGGSRAGEGGILRFARAYAPSSLAEQSLAALFSGRLPTHGGGIGWVEAQPAPEATTLATHLRSAGYRTGFVSLAPWAARPGFTRGFDAVQTSAGSAVALAAGALPSLAKLALRTFDEDLDTQRGENPENPHAPFLLVAHWPAPDLRGSAPTAQAGDAIATAYDTALASSLRDASALVAGLEERGALARMALVLTSGHGYELLEHGDLGSGFTLHEEVVRVPLLVRLPGRLPDGIDSTVATPASAPASATVSAPVSIVRLVPTLIALAGAKPPGDAGAAARPLPGLGDISASTEREPAVIAELVVRERAVVRAVVDGDDKYLQTLREAPLADRPVITAGYEELQAAMTSGAIPTPPLFGEPVREALVRVGGDGLEEELPLAEHRELLSRMRAALREYQRLCEATGFAPPAITERMPIDPNDVRNLEALGYM